MSHVPSKTGGGVLVFHFTFLPLSQRAAPSISRYSRGPGAVLAKVDLPEPAGP